MEKVEILKTLEERNPLSDCIGFLESNWWLTSDFPLKAEESEIRASHWLGLLGEDFFEKYGRYTQYLVQRISQFRTWRGPVHADEFYRMFCKVVLEKQVYSFKLREWISESEAIEIIFQSRVDLADEYRLAKSMGNQPRIDEVLEKCRGVIYGWEG